MKIIVPNLVFNNYSELISLDSVQYDLARTDIQVLISRGNQTFHCEVFSGFLLFKRTQFLYVDNEQTEVILSGYFELNVLLNGIPVSISEGRFDVGINDNNFYRL